MIFPSTLIVAIVALASQSRADDGQYHPSAYGASVLTTVALATAETSAAAVVVSSATATATGTSATTTKAATLATTTTPVTAVSGASSDWQAAVTWPAGCENWANPCPAGAHISGGSVAAAGTGTGVYTNGFTSYLTETDSNGIITGMPAVATVAAGVATPASSAATTLSTVKSSNGTISTSKPSSTQSGFSSGSSSPAQSNNSAPRAIVGSSAVFVMVTIAAFML